MKGVDYGERLRDSGWRQGDLIRDHQARELLSNAIDRKPEVKVEFWLIVLTQDCDLVRDQQLEPFVELIVAVESIKEDKQRQNGRSTRSLQLQAQLEDAHRWLECSIHDRFRIPKELLARPGPSPLKGLGLEEQRILRQWIARRYTRRPFPNAFEDRLDHRKGAIAKLLKSDTARELISAIYIETQDVELEPDQPYTLAVIIAVPAIHIENATHSNAISEFEERFASALNKRVGLTLSLDGHGDEQIEIRTEEDLTLAEIRRYKRLEVDYRSSDDDLRPPDGIDSI